MSAIYDFIRCPICGKELVDLCWSPDEDVHNYWCDVCGIDITVEVNREVI